MIDALIFAAIMTAMMFIIGSEFVSNYREITQEEEERKARNKYSGEMSYWKDKALKSRTQIKVINGGETNFTLENRR